MYPRGSGAPSLPLQLKTARTSRGEQGFKDEVQDSLYWVPTTCCLGAADEKAAANQASDLLSAVRAAGYDPVLLGDALRDPDDVPALLLLQLQEGVEDAEVELLHERVHVQVHLQG